MNEYWVNISVMIDLHLKSANWLNANSCSQKRWCDYVRITIIPSYLIRYSLSVFRIKDGDTCCHFHFNKHYNIIASLRFQNEQETGKQITSRDGSYSYEISMTNYFLKCLSLENNFSFRKQCDKQ